MQSNVYQQKTPEPSTQTVKGSTLKDNVFNAGKIITF
jgi:hypothetical protein